MNFLELISVYFDGELSDFDKQRVDEHLRSCVNCAALLETYNEISTAVEESLVEAPDVLLGRVMAGVNTAPKQIKPRRQLHRTLMRYVPVAACLLLTLVVATQLPYLGCGSSTPTQYTAGTAPEALLERQMLGANRATVEAEQWGVSAADAEMPPPPTAAMPPTTGDTMYGGGFDPVFEPYGAFGHSIVEGYFAFISMRGELPERLLVSKRLDDETGRTFAIITREAAQELIRTSGDLIDYIEYGDEDAEMALVGYFPE